MNSYKYVFFDLDGTLSDSAPGIINAVVYALGKMGVETGEREALKAFVGPPLIESFTGYCGFSQERANEAIVLFREYYRERGINENTMYDGIPELLRALSEDGLRLAVATSKPEGFARRIIPRYGIADYFEYIAGSTMDETRVKKDEVIGYALETLGISDPKSVVMIGDRRHDVSGAARFGMDCVGVLYGYGSREELLSAGAKYLAETPADVARLILN